VRSRLGSRAIAEGLEVRQLLAITYSVASGGTLNIFPISGMPNPSLPEFDSMYVNLTSVPGVQYGTIAKLQGMDAYGWGTYGPNSGSSFAPPREPSADQNRIRRSQGLRFTSDGTGVGQSVTIPVTFNKLPYGGGSMIYRDDTIVININPAGPTITQQPQPYTPLVALQTPNQKVTLSVTATGQGPFTFQWYKFLPSPNTTYPIAGATGATYDVEATTTPTTTLYWVRVSNPYGSADSLNATVAVTYPVVSKPGGPYVVGEAGRSVTLQGNGEYAAIYNWDFNGNGVYGEASTPNGDERGANAVFRSLPTDNGGKRYTISLQATAVVDVTAYASTTVTVANYPPTATFRSNGTPGVLTFTNQFDSVPDLAVLTYSYDFNNDGTFDGVSSSSASATVPTNFLAGYLAGTPVKGRVTDRAGAYTEYLATVSGRIFTVNSTANTFGQTDTYIGAPLTLRSAIDLANADPDADQIVFASSVQGSTFTVNQSGNDSAFTVTAPLTITGPTGNSGITLRAEGEHRAFTVAAGVPLNLQRLTLRDFVAPASNGVGGLGGAIYNQGALSILSCTLASNTARKGSPGAAPGRGGAIYNDGGSVTIITSTLAGNVAEADASSAGPGLGGAIFSRNGSVELTHVTAGFNAVSAGATGTPSGSELYLFADGVGRTASALVRNSILWGTSGTASSVAYGASNGAAAPTSSGTNNILRVAGSFGGASSSADPQLYPLTNNGGPTQSILMPNTSPAIRGGTSSDGVLYDQRGSRFPAIPDIGSMQATGSLVVTTTVDEDDSSSDPAFGAGTSLREALTYAQQHLGPDTITFAPNLAGQRIVLSIMAEGGLASAAALRITDGDDLTIQGPTSGAPVTITLLASAFPMSMIRQDAGNLTINNITFADGHAVTGGAIYQNRPGGAPNSSLTLNGCTFSNNTVLNSIFPNQGSGGAIAGNRITANDCVFVGNSAAVGGAIVQFYSSGLDVLRLTQCTFTGNSATRTGGAIQMALGTIRQSTIAGNRTDNYTGGQGGALQISTTYSDAVALENTIVAGNTADAGNPPQQIVYEIFPLGPASRNNLIGLGNSGGLVDGVNGNIVGVADPGLSPLGTYYGGRIQTMIPRANSPARNAGTTLADILIDPNGVARPQEGAYDIGATEFHLVESLTVTTATDEGDGTSDAYQGTGTSLREALAYAAQRPGADVIAFDPAVFATGRTIALASTLTIGDADGVTISAPAAGLTLDGRDAVRAIQVTAGAVATLDGLTITRGASTDVDAASGPGGGVQNFGTLTLSNSTLFANSAAAGGSAMANFGTLTLVNSTLAGNTATGSVGGAFYNGGGTADLRHVTVSGNANSPAATSDASGLNLPFGAVTIANSIVAGNTGGAAQAGLSAGGASLAGSNVVLPTLLNGSGDLLTSVNTATDPKLGPLADNGGRTRTFLPLPGSPAINTGTASGGNNSDQRGVPRDAKPDLGATEFTDYQPQPQVTTVNDEDDGTADPRFGGGTSLREAIQYAQASADASTITFAPALAGQTVTLSRAAPGPGNFFDGSPDNTALVISSVITLRGPATGPGVTLAIAPGTQRRHFLVLPGASLTLDSLTVTGGNVPGQRGGAVMSGGTLAVRNTTFTNNTAGEGGALQTLYLPSSLSLSVVNSTFTGNTADYGGAISSAAVSTSIVNCTITGNTTTAGGALTQYVKPAVLTNTILSGNANAGPSNFSPFPGTSGSIDSASSNNLIDVPLTMLRLGAFADNGGSTRTFLPLPGSPAINGGSSVNGVTADQRGVTRPQGSAPDIGAVERASTAAVVSSASFDFLTRQALTVNFNADASVTFSRSDLTLLNQTTNQTLNAGTLSWNDTGTRATADLTNQLPDGNYRATIGGQSVDLFVLAGDFNRDRTVNFDDLLLLAANYNQSGKDNARGDASYDGTVNFDDLLLLAANYNRSLPGVTLGSIAAPPAPPVSPLHPPADPNDDPSSVIS
jgi:CSLREA domain-containing protein